MSLLLFVIFEILTKLVFIVVLEDDVFSSKLRTLPSLRFALLRKDYVSILFLHSVLSFLTFDKLSKMSDVQRRATLTIKKELILRLVELSTTFPS